MSKKSTIRIQQFKGTIGEFFTGGLTDRRLEKRYVPPR